MQVAVGETSGLGPEHDQVGPGGQTTGGPVEVAGRCPEAAAQAVTDDRRADLAPDGEGDAHLAGAGQVHDRHRAAPRSTPLAPERVEGRTVADPSDQAERRPRPFCRRDRTIARPARVFIR